jgi:hypothetical protein
MLQFLVVVDAVVNVGLGLLVSATGGGAANIVGLPSPLPFYGTLLGIFLIATGVAFIPAIWNPRPHRFYLWIMGVGVKLTVAALFVRLWALDVAPAAVLVAALGDGALAVLLAIALLRQR